MATALIGGRVGSARQWPREVAHLIRELEMQNEALREAQQDLEASRDRYVDLYDFAPVGYVTLDAEGVIRQINLTATRMLGTERAELIGRPLAGFVAKEHKQRFRSHLRRCAERSTRASCELILCPAAGPPLHVRLDSICALEDEKTLYQTAVTDTTECRRSNEGSRQAQEDWKEAFNAMTDSVAILDFQHRVLRVNRAMAERLNLSPEQCVGRRCYEIVHGTSQPPESCPHAQSCRDGLGHTVELEEPRLAGKFLVTTSPRCDARGRVTGTVHVARDITPLKETEKALQRLNAELEKRVAEQTAEIRRQSAYHRSLIEANLDLLVTIGPDGKITDVNAATERVTGRPRDELVGTDFSDCFTEPDKAKAGYEQVFRDGLVRDCPLDIRHVDGHTIPVAYNATVFRTEAGQVAGVFADVRDVSEHRRAEEVLKAERQRLYDLLETLPVYVVLLSTDYHVAFANRSFRERFGESHGRHCHEYRLGRTEPWAFRETCDMFKTGRPHHWEGTGPNDDSVIDMYAFPFTDADGSPMILELGIDITARRRAENESRRMREELAHVDRVARMGELAASLAHEINQPLAAILSNAQAARRLLACAPPDLDEVREIVDDIIRDDKRAGNVIRRLRLMLRREKRDPESLHVNDTVGEVVQLLHSEILGRGVALSMELAPRLPAVQAGRVEVQQVMVNLILNALDALRDVPRDRRKIVIRTRTADAAVVVAIRDRGCGIPSPKIDSIFEPFFTTKAVGLGMGLAICRRMIEAYGGRIWAANNEHAGATVSFSLPFTPAGRETRHG